MKLGLVGLPQVGKRTLFRLLTGQEADFEGGKSSVLGLATVRDARFDRLVAMYGPEKITPAQMVFEVFPDLDLQAGRSAQVFQALEEVDVICYLARDFEDDTVFHIDGSVDARRDIRAFSDELMLNDMMFVDKRLERLVKERGRKTDAQRADRETELLKRMQTHLEAGRPLLRFDMTDEDLRLVSYPFLTRKPVVVIVNIGEGSLGDEARMQALSGAFPEQAFQWIAVSAKVEQEISLLEPEERAAFLEALQIERPALDRLTQLCYSSLGLISFFTVGDDEVRAWTIRRGSLVPQAGRAIHADIGRGFIRAEVMSYEDHDCLGSEQRVKEAGKLMQKGRDYRVADGDILHFLFKV